MTEWLQECPSIGNNDHHYDSHQREWLGFATSKEEESATTLPLQEEKMGRQGGGLKIEELRDGSQYRTFVVENDETATAAEPSPPDPPLSQTTKKEDNTE